MKNQYALVQALLVMLLLFTASGCSSTPPPPVRPEWTVGAARTVDNGYIVYVESSEDADLDRAKFKAEAAALEDLANECSFIPKEARVEDRYLEKTGEKTGAMQMNHAFVKVGIEFQDCDHARKTILPDEIRKQANVPMTEEVKRYQELLGKPDTEEVADSDDASGPAGTDDNDLADAPNRPAPIVADDHVRFFIVREQIWHEKQDVILAPPNTYVAGSPAQTTYLERVNNHSTQVVNYEAAHPEVKAVNHPWSHYRSQVIRTHGAVGQPRALRKDGVRAPPRPGRGNGQASPQKKGGGKKRRRRH